MLRELLLDGNQLDDAGAATVVNSLQGNTVLTKLYLHNNQITTLPPSIGTLAGLRELDLHLNPLVRLHTPTVCRLVVRPTTHDNTHSGSMVIIAHTHKTILPFHRLCLCPLDVTGIAAQRNRPINELEGIIFGWSNNVTNPAPGRRNKIGKSVRALIWLEQSQPARLEPTRLEPARPERFQVSTLRFY